MDINTEYTINKHLLIERIYLLFIPSCKKKACIYDIYKCMYIYMTNDIHLPNGPALSEEPWVFIWVRKWESNIYEEKQKASQLNEYIRLLQQFFFFQRIQIPLSWGQHLPLYLLYVSPPQTFISWHLREDYNTQRRNRVVTAPLSQQDPSIRWDSSTFTHLRELPETEYKSRTEREKVLSVWTWNMPNVQSHI